MTIAENNIKSYLLEEYYNQNFPEFDINLSLVTQSTGIARPVIQKEFDQLESKNYIEYKQVSRDYYHIVLLPLFFNEYKVKEKQL